MDKRIDVLSIGEILIDFTPAGFSAAGEMVYERNPGGAPANVAVAVSRQAVYSTSGGALRSDRF